MGWAGGFNGAYGCGVSGVGDGGDEKHSALAEDANMKHKLLVVVFLVAASVHATEWGAQLPWNMKTGYTDWQRCRYRGVDLIGEAKLVNFNLAKTNEYGVEATFLFTGMMKGAPGEYIVTIPNSMRDPLNMMFDWDEWTRTKLLEPWKWKPGETYGCISISNTYYGIRMVDWIVPLDKWGAFKASAEKERAEFEAFVKEKKLERLVLEKKIKGIWDREDLGETEKDVRVEQIEGRNNEIYNQVQDKGFPYFILEFDWNNPDQTWP